MRSTGTPSVAPESWAVAAFDYTAGVLETHHPQAPDGAPSSAGKLLAIIDVFASMVTPSLVRGRCPLLH